MTLSLSAMTALSAHRRPLRGHTRDKGARREAPRLARRDETESDVRNEPMPLRRQVAIAVVVMALALVTLVALALYGALHDPPIPWNVIAIDVAEQIHVQGYVGFIEKLVWFLWVVAGTAAFLSAIVLWRRGCRDRRLWFFLLATLLTAVLLLDDSVMLHERSNHEELLYVLYALAMLALLGWFRPTAMLLPVLASALLAVSIVVDEIPEIWGLHEAWGMQLCCIEDSAKLMGAALWAAFLVSHNLTTVGGVASEQQLTFLQSASRTHGRPKH